MHFSSVKSDSEGLLPECSIGMKEALSENDSSRSTHGNLRLVYCKLPVFISLAYQTLAPDHDNSQETTHRRYTQWLKSLQVRAMHKLTPEFGVKLSPCMCSHSQSCHDCMTADSHKPCWFVCHDTNQHNVLLAQACPTKHLLVILQ